jgi:DNA polymerase III subunit delta'
LDLFNDIVGQDKAVSFLVKTLEAGNGSHAYLFSGPEGVGKRGAAIAYAAALNCDGGGCGVCLSCRKSLAATHPDVEVITPDGRSLKIEQIREIGKTIGLKPFEGRSKVYVIQEAHLMTTEAQNALLKNLEEPPGYVVFILTAPGADTLLPTIVSRCQEVSFSSVRPSLIRGILEKAGIDTDKAETLAALSGGSAGRALRMAGDGRAGDVRGVIMDNIRAISAGDIFTVFQVKDLIMPMVKEKEKTEGPAASAEVVAILSSWYRDLIVWRETGDESLIINKDMKKEIAAAAEQAGDAPAAALTALQTAAEAFRTNANRELLTEYALLSVSGA